EHVLLALDQLGDDLVDLRVHERLPAGDGHHRRAALLDRPDRLVHRHPLLQERVRLLDLPAPGALEVAREQRLQLDQEGELVMARQLLAHQVGPDPQALSQWHGHCARTSLGKLNRMFSVVMTRSQTSTGPRPDSAAMMSSHTAGGADAPAVRPIVDTPASQPSWMSDGPSMRCAGVPARSAVSTSPTEMEALADTATRTRPDSAATARMACCLLVVA